MWSIEICFSIYVLYVFLSMSLSFIQKIIRRLFSFICKCKKTTKKMQVVWKLVWKFNWFYIYVYKKRPLIQPQFRLCINIYELRDDYKDTSYIRIVHIVNIMSINMNYINMHLVFMLRLFWQKVDFLNSIFQMVSIDRKL